MDATPPVIDRRCINLYMTRHYPAREICDFLSLVAPLKFREFSFSEPMIKLKPATKTTTTQVNDKADEEFVVRNLSFEDALQFSKEIAKRQPSRIDVGATWTCEPNSMAAGEIDEGCHKLCAREIVFDIDVDEYNNGVKARGCCVGANWCERCWPIVMTGCSVAVQRLKDAGAAKIAWFYSGRRGMHCWIPGNWVSWCGNAERAAFMSIVVPPALELVNSALSKYPDPSAVSTVYYLSGVRTPEAAGLIESMAATNGCTLPSGGEFLRWYARMHPMCAFNAISKAAETMDVYNGNSTVCKLHWVISELAKNQSGGIVDEMISDLMAEVDRFNMAGDIRNAGTSFNALAAAIALAAVQCLMPRFDTNVTPDQQHLLRCPMTVNPTTGRVAIFVEEKSLGTFYPLRDCPSLARVGDDGDVEFENKQAFDQSISLFKKWIGS